ncbi:MAG: sirohydrochlorin cobaltochelatase [Sneathiella sp.]|nr:sirohydrochlorin cobaltochelatase [Sneathiella sp.]
MVPSRPSLIIVGHGSSASLAAEQAAEEHALTLRQSQRFGTILTHFIQRGNALPELPKGEVFILPFFMSDGFFVRKKIPEIFGLEDRLRRDENRSLIQCDAIGVDAELAEIVIDSVKEQTKKLRVTDKDVSVLLVAHGSQKSTASREAALFQRDQVRARSLFERVEVALLEEPPLIIDMLRTLEAEGAKLIIVVGLFSANGPHAAEDVPKAVQAFLTQMQDKKRAEVHYLGAVGVRREIVKLIQNSISRRAAEIG